MNSCVKIRHLNLDTCKVPFPSLYGVIESWTSYASWINREIGFLLARYRYAPALLPVVGQDLLFFPCVPGLG